jgi:hypothetical protein
VETAGDVGTKLEVLAKWISMTVEEYESKLRQSLNKSEWESKYQGL